MFEAIIQNLINVGWALLIFLAAYLANTVLALWYNTKVLRERFYREKFINGALKCATFLIGLTLLCIAITTLPLFALQVGWAVPEEFTDLFTSLVIVGTFLLVACKYIKEALVKLTAILNATATDPEEGKHDE